MLQPDKLKKLNDNALKMHKAGKSNQDILAMKDAFMKQFGGDEVKKKGNSISAIPTESTDSEQVLGSSVTPLKKTPKGFPKIDTNSILPDFDQMKTESISTAKKTENKESKSNVEGFFGGLANRIDKGIAIVSKGLYDTPSMLYDLGSEMLNPAMSAISKASGKTPSEILSKETGITNIPSKMMEEKIKRKDVEYEKYRKEIGGDISTAYHKGDYVNVGKHALLNSMESLPMVIPALLTGGESLLANVITAMTSSAGQYETLNKENPEMDTKIKLANSAVNGALEIVVGKYIEGISGNVWKNLLKDKGVKEGAKIMTNSFKKTLEKAIGKNPILGTASGYAEERITDGLQQYNDILTGAKTEFDMDQNLGAGLSYLGFGGANAVLMTGQKAYVKNETRKKVKSSNKEISNLQTQLQNPDLPSDKKGLIKSTIKNIYDNNKKILGEDLKKLDSFSDVEKTELIDIDNQIDDINSDALEVKHSVDIDDSNKKILLDNLKEKYKVAEDRKNEILSKIQNVKAETTTVEGLPLKEQETIKKQAMEDLVAELNPDGKKDITITNEQVVKRANKIYSKSKTNEQASTTSETQPQTEVPQQAESEKIDVVAPSVEKPISLQEEKVSMGEKKTNFNIDGVEEFHHASNNKRNGRLSLSNAPQFGTGVYFSTNKGIVEDEFGNKNTTSVKLNIENPVYTGTNKWGKVEELAIETADSDYGKRKGLELGEDETYFRYDKENTSEVSEIPSEFISEAAKKLGYDAIIDEGSHQYENEVVVLDESKIIYPEDAKIPPTNTPAGGNIPLGASNVGESRNSKQQNSVQESVPSSVDGGEGKVDAEVEYNGIKYTKNGNGNWVNDKTGNEIKGIGDKGKALIKELDAKQLPKPDTSNQEVSIAEKPTTKEKIVESKEKTPLEKAQDARREAKAKLDAKKKNLSIINGPEQHAQDLYDYHKALVAEAKEYVKIGVKTLAEFAEKIGEKVSVSLKQAWEEANDIKVPAKSSKDLSYDSDTINDVIESDDIASDEVELDKEEKGFKRKKGQSSVLKRIKEGGNSDRVNDIIEKVGLNIKQRKQEQIYANAVDFVKKVGIIDAYKAVKNGNVTDSDMVNVIYSTVLQGFHKMAQAEISKITDADELAETVSYFDELEQTIYNEFKTRTVDAGQGISMLNFIYKQNLDIKYSLSSQIDDFKSINNGVVPDDVLEKMKTLEKEYKEASKTIKDLENLLNEAKEQKDFDNIVEEQKRQPLTDEDVLKYSQEDFDRELQKAKDVLGNDYNSTVFENLKRQSKKDKISGKKEDLKLAKEKVLEDIRKVVRESMRQMSANPIAKPLEFANLVTKLAKLHIQEGALSLEDVANNIYNDLKDMSKDISKESITNILKSKPKRVMSEATKRKIYVSLLNKNIESLNNQIKAKKRDVASNEDKYKNDNEIKELRDVRSAKQEELSKVDPSYAESRKLANDLKLAESSLKEYQRRIDENDLSPKENLPKLINAKLKKLRDARDLKRKEFLAKKKKFDDSLKPINTPLTKEEMADKKHLSEVNNKIKSLTKMIDDLKSNIPKSNEGKSSVIDADGKISKLENELKGLKDSKKDLTKKIDKKEPLSDDEIYEQKIDKKLEQREKVLSDLIEGRKKDVNGNNSFWSSEISKVNVEIKKLREDLKQHKTKSEPKVTVDKNGNIKVPTEMIKDFISKGGTDLSEFAEQIHKSIKEEFPNVTVRDIRESVSNYGKKTNKTKPQIIQDIQKLKTEDKLRIEYEDLQNRISKEKNEIKKAEITQVAKRLKEQIKKLQDDLGITEEERTNRSVKYTKKRIEELQERIKNQDFSKKEVKEITESKELKEARIKKAKVQEEFDTLSYEQELKNRGFLDKSKAILKDFYDSQRVTLATGELSFVGAQGWFYMADKTFNRNTIKNLVNNFKGSTAKDWKTNPFGTAVKMIQSAESGEAIVKMINSMGTANNYLDFQRLFKEDPRYDLYLKMGIRILGDDLKSQIQDDNYIGNNILNFIRKPIHLIDRIEKSELKKYKISLAGTEKKRTTLQGYYEKYKTGKVSEKNKKTSADIFSNANPLSTFERGNNTFMNIARKQLADTYIDMLEASGKNPIDHLREYKEVASAINTITGSGNLHKKIEISLRNLNLLMFSARFFTSNWNLTPPISLIYLAKLGNYDNIDLSDPKTLKNWKPSVAQKAFVKPMLKGAVASFAVSIASIAIKNAIIDDDDELTEEEKLKQQAHFELDSRSSNYMQVVQGNVSTNYFGAYLGNVVLLSKLFSGQSKNRQGDIIENGQNGSRSDAQITSEYLGGKLHPTPGMFWRYGMGKKEEVLNEETGEKENRRMLFDERVGIDYQLQHNLLPIYIKTAKSIIDEDPVLGATYHNMWAFIGKQTNAYKDKVKKTPLDEFYKDQEKQKSLYDLPITEKKKIKVENRLDKKESLLKTLEGIKIAKEKGLPYYFSGRKMMSKEKVQYFDISSKEESMKKIRDMVDEKRKEFGLPREE